MRNHRVKGLVILRVLLVGLLVVAVSRSFVGSSPAVTKIETHAAGIAGAGDEGIRRVWEGGKP